MDANTLKNPFRDGLAWHSVNSYFQERFGQKVRKILVNAGFTCPNRDGTKGTGGCSYCNQRGSGTGSILPINEQVLSQITKYQQKNYNKFFVYFQSFSNTYAPVDKLKRIYDSALVHPDIAGIIIGTRPDCIDKEKIELIRSYSGKYEVWVEYGLQTIKESTLQNFNRRHGFQDFINAVQMTSGLGISITAHMILGLPGESRSDMLATAEALAKLPLEGIKIHSLYIEKGTRLYEEYRGNSFRLMCLDEYVQTICDILEILPPEMVIHRLTGDPDPGLPAVPGWTGDKNAVLNAIRAEMSGRCSWQGKRRLSPKKSV